MIIKLTKQQTDGIAEWREHCLKIGRDTSPVNKKLVESSWIKFYKILNKATPKFWYCQSPLQAQIIINIFPEIQKLFNIKKGANIKENIWNNIMANIMANIGENIKDNIRANLGVNIGTNIWDNIGENIWDNIEVNIRENIWDNIMDNIRANIGENIRDNIWNNIGDYIGNNIGNNIGENIWDNIMDNIGENIGDNIMANLGENIRDNIRDNIRENIWNNIMANIMANIKDNIKDNIGANIWANIKDNIKDNIKANIGANIKDNIRNNNFKVIDTYSWGQHDISWIAYYKYFTKYGLLPADKNFEIIDIWYDIACSSGWCYTFDNIVFVCEKPKVLNFNSRGQLHMDRNLALEYSDGYGLYMLNGISVPQWLAMTPAEKIDPKLAIEETNADVQREIIRKIGAERMLKALNAKELSVYTDTRTGLTYKLMEMKLGNINRKYLHFEHASMKGVFYTKPVPPECMTALAGYAWTRKLLERKNLRNITIEQEAELIANLPERVC